jgi:hypothetical protein
MVGACPTSYLAKTSRRRDSCESYEGGGPRVSEQKSDVVASATGFRTPTRRRFLQILGTGVGVWVVESQLGGTRADPLLELVDGTPSFTAAVHRREDMLDLRFAFFNLRVTPNPSGPVLTRIDSSAKTYISVGFGPQWVDEAAWHDSACSSTPTTPPPLPALIAAAVSTAEFGTGSRLVFSIPDSVTSIPYTIEGLLNWPQWSLSVPKSATAAGTTLSPAPPIAMPDNMETAIEAPWRIVLCPEPTATWAHALEPVTHNSRTEAWHTRLALPRSASDHRAQENDFGPKPTVRAVWSPDYDAAIADDEPFQTIDPNLSQTMESADRAGLVKLTADYSRTGKPPIPVTAKQLVLSPLGATLDLEGTWPTNYFSGVSIISWKHRGQQGRDNYVRVVHSGYLLPLGHRAVLIEESERRIDVVNGSPVAYLHKREFIVVVEPLKTYAASGEKVAGQPNEGRDFPFATAELTTLVTPPLQKPATGETRALFWPRIDTSPACDGTGGTDVGWNVVLVDREGNRSQVTMALEFADTTVSAGAAVASYKSQSPTGSRRLVYFGGQNICLAPPAKPGSTTLPTETLSFDAQVADAAVATNEAGFFPFMGPADVHLPAVQSVSGAATQTTKIGLEADFVSKGFDGAGAPKGGVFAQLLKADASPGGSLDLGFGDSSRSGGIAVPSLSIVGLSRDTGPVGGDFTAPDPFAKIKDGAFDPADFFKNANPKIFGNTELTDILADVTSVKPPSDGLPDPRVPGLVTELVYDHGRSQPPTAVKTTYKWQPALAASEIFNPKYTAPGGQQADASLELTVLLIVPIGNPSQRTSTITGDLRDFTIELPDHDDAFIGLGFERLAFSSANGAKPSVDVKLGTVRFLGDLEFVNKLEEFLKFPGSGLSIDVQPSGVSAGITIALPKVGIGVFSLENLAFMAGLVIPFDGKPVLAHFAFCTRENPFLLSVAIFGGGGFFALYLDSQGVQIFEISIEFGGNVSFDIVVASGGVHVLAGVYFKLDETGLEPVVVLTGFVKIGGSLSVLGLVTLSLEFDMSLTYEKDGDQSKAIGEASLTVSIDVAFFSIPVSMHVRKEFGGGGDPTFAQMLTSGDWTNYCNAFAA